MGKFVGLVGALTSLGAVAYLLAPLPPAETVKAASTLTPPSVAEAVPPARSETPRRPRRENTTLVHQIQRELQRLGCYTGNVDGQWSEATQHAMQELGERLRVIRPVDTPDYIMLALARDQQRGVCAQTQQRAVTTRPMTGFQTTAAPAGKEAADEPRARRTSRAIHATTPNSVRSPRAAASTAPAPTKAEAPRQRVALNSVEAARAAAARDELARIEQRAPLISRPTDTSQATQAPTDPSAIQPSPATIENSRMGLGVVNVDPLRAGIDPRNPNAPAILRGPPQPAPVTTARVGGAPERVDVTPPPPRRPARVVGELPAPPTAKQTRRAWQRTIFIDMQRNGP